MQGHKVELVSKIFEKNNNNNNILYKICAMYNIIIHIGSVLITQSIGGNSVVVTIPAAIDYIRF